MKGKQAIDIHKHHLHSPVLSTELVGSSVVEQQHVAIVIQHPDCLLFPQTEAGYHRYDRGGWFIGFQPINCLKTQTVDDQHTRAIREP